MRTVHADTNLFAAVDTSSMAESDKLLFNDIKNYFAMCKEKEDLFEADFSKPYLVFSYNLYELGLKDVAIQMLEHCAPTYFGKTFLEDIRLAEKYWQKAEKLKNKVKPAEKEEYIKCKQEAEFFIVAWGMIAKLGKMESFPHRDSFVDFLELLKDEKFEIQLMPSIGLVK